MRFTRWKKEDAKGRSFRAECISGVPCRLLWCEALENMCETQNQSEEKPRVLIKSILKDLFGGLFVILRRYDPAILLYGLRKAWHPIRILKKWMYRTLGTFWSIPEIAGLESMSTAVRYL